MLHEQKKNTEKKFEYNLIHMVHMRFTEMKREKAQK